MLLLLYQVCGAMGCALDMAEGGSVVNFRFFATSNERGRVGSGNWHVLPSRAITKWRIFAYGSCKALESI